MFDAIEPVCYYSELRRYVKANHPSEPHFIRQVISKTIPWVLMSYNLSDTAHTDVMANVPQIFSFPEGALTMTVADIPLAKRQAMQTKLENIGFSFGWATGNTTVREILEYISHSIIFSKWAKIPISAQNFDINKTVGSIPVAKRDIIQQHLNDLGVPTGWITGSTTIKQISQKIQKNDDGSDRLFGTGTKRKKWLFHDDED
jgi:hypothetical protein